MWRFDQDKVCAQAAQRSPTSPSEKKRTMTWKRQGSPEENRLSCERVHDRRDDNRATIFTSSRKEKADAVQELQAELSCQASETHCTKGASVRTLEAARPKASCPSGFCGGERAVRAKPVGEICLAAKYPWQLHQVKGRGWSACRAILSPDESRTAYQPYLRRSHVLAHR